MKLEHNCIVYCSLNKLLYTTDVMHTYSAQDKIMAEFTQKTPLKSLLHIV